MIVIEMIGMVIVAFCISAYIIGMGVGLIVIWGDREETLRYKSIWTTIIIGVSGLLVYLFHSGV